MEVQNVFSFYGKDKIEEDMFKNIENIPQLQNQAYEMGVKLAEELAGK